MSAFLIAAPTSGAGKTTVSLGLMRLFAQRGIKVQPAKSGPDYIDPKFHAVATGRDSPNLDAWAMPPDRIPTMLPPADIHIVEAAMGLFDGAGLNGRGSAADLAKTLNIPIVLIVDAAKQAHSVAALVRGFLTHDPDLTFAGVILNKVGSAKHENMLRAALRTVDIPILGAIPRTPDMILPERHLGLVQASEIPDLTDRLGHFAQTLSAVIDIDLLSALPPLTLTNAATKSCPPAQKIAVARDVAFEFAYPHMLTAWRDAGAEICFFSPLADHDVPDCDFVFLPGGYPELHAGQLSQATNFMNSLGRHAQSGRIYGECGGYITLGQGLIDANGHRHKMAGLLPLETSFADRKLHLGYRRLTPTTPAFKAPLAAHEFHYTTTLKSDGPPLFQAHDADGNDLGDMGLHVGTVFGSFAHIIDGF